MTTVIRRFYTIVGNVTLAHVREQNPNGARWVENINNAAKREESEVSKINYNALILC